MSGPRVSPILPLTHMCGVAKIKRFTPSDFMSLVEQD